MFELLSDKVTDLLDSSLIFIEVSSSALVYLTSSDEIQALIYDLIFSPLPTHFITTGTNLQYEPEVITKEAHDMVGQLVDFLTSTFMWLSHLPSAAREVRGIHV